jgi:hypothetical protein
VRVAAHGDAEHRRGDDLRPLARVLERAPAGGVEEASPRRVVGLDLGLVADPVRDRPGQPDVGVSQVVEQARQPAGGDQRVVVQQHQVLAAREGQPLVAGGGEPDVTAVQEHASACVSPCEPL